jgi:hypothetical protein
VLYYYVIQVFRALPSKAWCERREGKRGLPRGREGRQGTARHGLAALGTNKTLLSTVVAQSRFSRFLLQQLLHGENTPQYSMMSIYIIPTSEVCVGFLNDER